MISGFSFVHNAIKGGYPIREAIRAVRPYVDEVVIVDAQSNDGTRELLEAIPEVDRILNAEWGNDGGETLKRLHAMHTECKGDTIIHFEADEVFDDWLIKEAAYMIREDGIKNIMFWRLQVEQNFQRIRWYPELVHRVFPIGSVTKEGHTTNLKHGSLIPFKNGYLWDITNCFRDNFIARVEQQAELRKNTETPEPNYMMVPLHFTHPVKLTREQAEERLKEPHWEWKNTPLNIPEILKPLLGKTKYD